MKLYLLYDNKSDTCIRTSSKDLRDRAISKGAIYLSIVDGYDISIYSDHWFSKGTSKNLTATAWLRKNKEKS